ncbi:MAG: hypothetical protein IJC46_03310 [Clostridia bacterium]|nr:hypothetical protein [Clostridia bacterium]
MTIQAILNRAVSLLGYSTGAPSLLPERGRLLAALDSAVGEIARCFPLQARCKITLTEGAAALPPQVLTPRALFRSGKRVPLILEEGKLRGEDGDYTLVYYRVPPNVMKLEETALLPYPEDVLRALPFYCAALYVMCEDFSLYTRLMEQYNTKLSAALGYRPAAAVEAGGSL